MVLTESLSFHANHIGAIRTNKEQLKDVYNVDIDITRRRFGEYQEIDITGSTKDIRNCKKAFEIVVEQAEIDYQDYLDRKIRRRGNEIKQKKEFKVPEMIEGNKKRANTNPFAALEGLDEEDEDENSYEVDGEDKPYMESFPVLSTYDPNVSWGDMSDDEE
jgi:hypothetical protein